ncbi:chemotaxis protein CheA [Desulfonema magnum]|uniref:Chemotaxis protein CheA n=1 Tax=Desulfonema magnum TaxID=45655 RepID=A0A975BMP6_9BACT|nr:chemotaxis protein CheA [Desulfonema magnum]QTA88351.1 Chemotaxis protein CheA [Desulfonema magnum]
MDRHREAYREEAQELLAKLEASLLELEETPQNTELIGNIFRALHTIKGSGAMFGFDDIARFTHEIETVFELVRDGKLSVSKELMNLTLSSLDHIKAMLDEAESDEISKSEIIHSFRNLLLETGNWKLETGNWKLETGNRKPETENSELETENPELVQISDSDFHKNVTYRIRFHPGSDIFTNGTNPILLLNELRGIGYCSVVAQINDIPTLEDINPEACYTSWDIILTTSKGINSIKDVFIFVEDNCEIDIEMIDETGSESDTIYKKVGEILVDRGDLSTDDLNQVLETKKLFGEMLVEEKKVEVGAVESALAEQKHVKKMLGGRREKPTASSIRVPAARLDSLVDLVGELVTVQARLSQKASFQNEPELISIAEEVERLTGEIRNNTMSIRMLPIGTIFTKFKRLVRDLCNELDKEAVLVIEGGDTELDKTVIDQLNEPLMHIIRNTIDHGIEPPNVRESLGKPRQGTVHLAAEHSGPNVFIRISGDGSGINPEDIRAKAMEKGLISPDAKLTDKEIFSLIFIPGLSTAKQLSGVSGRGVGMDVVKRTIENLRGTVGISSKKGRGTTVTLKLPLTLAIIDGLLVKMDEGFFVFPLSIVEECVELAHDDLNSARQRNMMNFRGEIIPYLSLREMFMVEGKNPAIEQIIVVESRDGRVGFGVDRVMGQYQTVIKTLGKIYREVEGFSGATILGDGTVALILDIARLVRCVEDKEVFSV